MTVARRLAAIESSLTPTQLVLRWLSEAHAYPSFTSYGESLLDLEPRDLPLTRLLREAEASARATVGSRAREEVQRAVRKTIRETVFRFLLVVRINVTAHELLEKEQLLQAALAAHLTALARASDDERQEEKHRSWLRQVLDLLIGRSVEHEAAALARTAAEERYLDGYPALFADAIEAWDALVQSGREN